MNQHQWFGAYDEQGVIRGYWQLPNTTGDSANDHWIPYADTGDFPASPPLWDSSEVYVGVITYTFGQAGMPLIGAINDLEIIE